MKSMKRLSVLLCVLLICSILFTACGEKPSDSTNDEAAPGETVVVLETTGDGGTIVQDSEGNKITKDENGNVISVVDKAGNPVDVQEYISTHSWIVNSDTSGGSDGDDSSGGSGSAGGSGSSGGSGGSSSSGGTSSGSIEAVEESIPVVIATIPDEEDMIEIPDV